MRNYDSQKSRFCKASTALEDLDKVARIATYEYLVLSYNSEGIMPQHNILDVLSQYGEVELEQFEYLRFKAIIMDYLKQRSIFGNNYTF